MQKPSTYCQYVLTLGGDGKDHHTVYHDSQYGFPLEEDNELFCRLILEINQAGLSWTTILKKEADFRKAYHDFDIGKVAAYTEKDITRLLGDERIIRNRLKVRAAVENAGRILRLKEEFGTFKGWLDRHHPQSLEEWTRLFKATFTFTGGEIVREFLVSTGYLPGAHDTACPVHARVVQAAPPWLRVQPATAGRTRRGGPVSARRRKTGKREGPPRSGTRRRNA